MKIDFLRLANTAKAGDEALIFDKRKHDIVAFNCPGLGGQTFIRIASKAKKEQVTYTTFANVVEIKTSDEEFKKIMGAPKGRPKKNDTKE